MTRVPSSTFVVATYNVHSCVGRDGRRDMARTSDVLRRLQFDVIGLQEVESHESGGHGSSQQMDFLAEKTSCRAIPGPTIKSETGDYGNALLTRRPVLDVRRHDLSVSGREPRGALEVTLQMREARARFIATHLGLRPAERRFQVRALLDIVAADRATPTFVLGDFNEWFPWSRSRRRLRGVLGPVPMPATFPACCPMFALDHIYARPRSAMRRLEIFDEPLARVASDHLPVRAVATLDFLSESGARE